MLRLANELDILIYIDVVPVNLDDFVIGDGLCGGQKILCFS